VLFSSLDPIDQALAQEREFRATKHGTMYGRVGFSLLRQRMLLLDAFYSYHSGTEPAEDMC
jgi:hypothetical protein